MKKITISLIMFPLLIILSNVSAAMLSFGCITNNSATDCGIGEAQISAAVTDAGSGQVRFTFSNSGATNIFLSDIYFDNGEPGSSLSDIAALEEMMGVDFQTPIPGMGGLPGGNTVGFNTTADLEANNAPGAVNGVNPGEMLGILINLVNGQTFNDVITELSTGALRVGIHVQGFEPGSESFVNAPVPVPAAVWFLGSGLLALVGLSRRRSVT